MTTDEENRSTIEVDKQPQDGGDVYQVNAAAEQNMSTTTAPVTYPSSSTLADPFGNPLANNKAFPPLYTRPLQRQKWGDAQIHPVVNWGDLFFDLFYVGAAYNLSYIIVYQPTQQEGLLYFLGAFLPIMILWMDKTFYDARFFTHDDLLHRGFEIVGLCALATAVVHIRPVGILQQSAKYVDMFGLALGLTVSTAFTVSRYVEIWLWVDGGPEAKMEARRGVILKLIPFAMYLAATILAGCEYYGENVFYYQGHTSNTNSTGDNYNNTVDKDNHRFLAETETIAYESESNDVPIWLLLVGSLVWLLSYVILVICFMPGGGRHKTISVPNNVSFVIHRYGEWVMLLLGESILALVIVDVLEPAPGYYLTFYAGIVSVILLQYLHYRSQPHHADEHAMRRSKEQGIAFSMLMVIYSASLVLVGTAFKMLVNEHAMGGESYGNEEHRFLLVTTPAWQRMLAGASDVPDISREERQQRVANLFCESMAVTWLCSELLMAVHRDGIKDNWGRCKCKHSNKRKKTCVVFILVKMGLIVFIVTLPLYMKDATSLALIGLAGIIAQVCLRFVGSVVFPDIRTDACDIGGTGGHGGAKHGDDDDSMEEKWPNITRARAEPGDLHPKHEKRVSCPLP